MISRTLASVFPRQSPSSLIFWSINAEAEPTGTGLFMYRSNSLTYFRLAALSVTLFWFDSSSEPLARYSCVSDAAMDSQRWVCLTHLFQFNEILLIHDFEPP
jgi:hypothetical protein